MNQKFGQLNLFRCSCNRHMSILWTFIEISYFYIGSRCLSKKKQLNDEENFDLKFYRISEIFCPPRPIIQPIKSLAMVISRWVWIVGRVAGRALGISGAKKRQTEIDCRMIDHRWSINLPAGKGTPGPIEAREAKAFNYRIEMIFFLSRSILHWFVLLHWVVMG